MKYLSTRGGLPPIGFLDAVMTGLAPDGGLLLPETLPDVSDRLPAWSKLTYGELAFEVMRIFATDLPEADLNRLVERSYAAFDHPETTPVVEVGELRVMELFHGPTLAFKDVALQFLGNLFEYVLEGSGGRLNVLAATSGDTGSAAICGLRGKANVNVFVMHPAGRTSPLQERQMTSVLDSNVFNLAVEGTFDDCQRIMKTLFADAAFKEAHALGSVNSVNWARVLAQTVYYFYGAFRTMEATGADRVRFSVPTGNFGDVLAGYLAARMGLPVDKLILATNENDILSRFFNDGNYVAGTVAPTISPSMDIQVASNFERYLYYRVGEDAVRTKGLMEAFSRTGSLRVEPVRDGVMDELFVAGRGDTASTLATIRKYAEAYGYVLDPHTAVGVCVAERFREEGVPTVCLATAHPAKFPQAISDAGVEPPHHPTLDALAEAETRCASVPNDVEAVRRYLLERL